MSTISRFEPLVRRTIFDVMVNVAQADGRIARQEFEAMCEASQRLGLDMSLDDENGQSGLEREAVVPVWLRVSGLVFSVSSVGYGRCGDSRTSR